MFRLCMPFDQFDTTIGDTHCRQFWAGDYSGLNFVGESAARFGCNRRPP